MILRRIKSHIEMENWFAVFIDFLIVVVGVFIGIQVADWNAERLERAQERNHVTAHVTGQNWFAVCLPSFPCSCVGMHRLSFTRLFDRSLMFESGSYASGFGYITELEDSHSHAGAWEREDHFWMGGECKKQDLTP